MLGVPREGEKVKLLVFDAKSYLAMTWLNMIEETTYYQIGLVRTSRMKSTVRVPQAIRGAVIPFLVSQSGPSSAE